MKKQAKQPQKKELEALRKRVRVLEALNQKLVLLIPSYLLTGNPEPIKKGKKYGR
jgi:hypothetical protein